MQIHTRTFEVALDNQGSTLAIKINEDPSLRTDNLTLETWGSSLILARQLHALDLPPTAFVSTSSSGPILELGAGTGLAGLAAAAVWNTHVILTDLSAIITGLARNISLNQDLLSLHNGSASYGALDWSSPSSLSLHRNPGDEKEEIELKEENKASIILAADTVYDEAHPELLANVIAKWLKRRGDSRVIIAYPLRVAYLEEIRGLWEKFEDIGLVAVEEGKERMKVDDVKFDDEELHEWSVWKWKS